MSTFNDPKQSVRLIKQDGQVWFEYFGGEDKVLINPRIAEMINARLGVQYIDFDEIPPEDIQERRAQWSSTEETVGIGMPGGNVTMNIGMELFVPRRVENKTGVDLKNGQFVYISSGSGNNVRISLAKADAHATSENTIAMLTEDIDDNAKGYATTFGIVRGDSSQPIDTSSYPAGTKIYLSESVAGGFTDTLPPHPNYLVSVGQVFRQHATEGAILVNIESPVCACKIAGGESFVYLDENFSAIATLGASAPDLIDYNATSIRVPAFDGAGTMEEVNAWSEYQHDGLESVDETSTVSISVHAHVGPVNTNIGDVKLFCEYHVQDPMTGQVKATGTMSNVSSNVADGTAWVDYVFSIGTIDITNAEIGDQIGLRVYRDPTDSSDTYASDIYMKTWGYHYKVDSLGSRNLTSKG